jgi:hypothetical protein
MIMDGIGPKADSEWEEGVRQAEKRPYIVVQVSKYKYCLGEVHYIKIRGDITVRHVIVDDSVKYSWFGALDEYERRVQQGAALRLRK